MAFSDLNPKELSVLDTVWFSGEKPGAPYTLSPKLLLKYSKSECPSLNLTKVRTYLSMKSEYLKRFTRPKSEQRSFFYTSNPSSAFSIDVLFLPKYVLAKSNKQTYAYALLDDFSRRIFLKFVMKISNKASGELIQLTWE